MEPLRSGALKIWMTDDDLQQWGLSFDTMSADDPATRQALRKLLVIAGERLAFAPEASLTVEALPAEGGCLLLITPRRRRILFRQPEPQIYAVRSADDLLLFGSSLIGLTADRLPVASLYGWKEEYRLILYPESWSWAAPATRLEEFAEKVGEGSPAAAFVEEHGKPMLIGNALHRLWKSFESHAPGSAHPPH